MSSIKLSNVRTSKKKKKIFNRDWKCGDVEKQCKVNIHLKNMIWRYWLWSGEENGLFDSRGWWIISHFLGANTTGDNLGVSPQWGGPPRSKIASKPLFLFAFSLPTGTLKRWKTQAAIGNAASALVVIYYFYLILFQTLHFLSALLLSMLRETGSLLRFSYLSKLHRTSSSWTQC